MGRVKLTCRLCGLEDGACICAHIPHRDEVCPWNPFPHDSAWGSRIDEQYRRDNARSARKLRSRALLASDKGE
jgi:hypothetical protein